jgi:hypothetical protein
MAVIPHLPYSYDLAPCDFFLLPDMKLKRKDAGLIPLRRSRLNRRECLTLWQKMTSRKRSNIEETVGLVSTCGRELLWGWRRPIGLMMSLWFLQRHFGIFWIPPHVLCTVYCIRREVPTLNNDDFLNNIKYLVHVMELYCCFWERGI